MYPNICISLPKRQRIIVIRTLGNTWMVESSGLCGALDVATCRWLQTAHRGIGEIFLEDSTWLGAWV